MNSTLQTLLNGAAQKNEQTLKSPQDHGTGRPSRPAGKFSRLLSDFGSKSDQRAIAYVKRGESVTFKGVPFNDQFGNQVDPSDPTSCRKTDDSHRGRRQPRLDRTLSTEMALSENRGTSQLIPSFKKRAAEHLLQTDELRMGILSGDLKTPGNRSHVLRKRLESDRKESEVQDPKLWLQEVRTHMAHTAIGDATRLAAQAESMSDADKMMDRTRAELRNPLERDVQPFSPPKLVTLKPGQTAVSGLIQVNQESISDDETEPVIASKNKKTHRKPNKRQRTTNTVNFQSEMGEAPAIDLANGNLKKASPARAAGTSNPDLLSRLRMQSGVTRSTSWASTAARGNDSALTQSDLTTPKAVSRVTVERSNEKPTEFTSSKSAQTTQKPVPQGTPEIQPRATRSARPSARPEPTVMAQSYSRTHRAQPMHTAATEPAQTAAEQVSRATTRPAVVSSQPRVATRNRVVSMEQNGWHVHAPSTKAVEPGRVGRPPVKKMTSTKPKSDRSTTSTDKNTSNTTTQTQSSRTSSKEEIGGAKPGLGKVPLAGKLGSTLAARTGRSISTSAQGLQNLQELMQRISSQAKVLKGDGVMRVQVPLKPGKLGNMLLNVIRSNGKYILKMTAERPEGVRALEQQLPAIREHLATQGIQVERIEVESGSARQQDSTSEQERRDATDQQRGRRSENGRNSRPMRDRSTVNTDRKERQGPLDTGLATVEYLG
jgi:Flagellar hook-length control protein FliK